MGLTIRHYLVGEDGSLSRVPRRVAEALPFGTDAIPACAGTRQKVADVLIENEDRRPVRILDVTGRYWEFDDDGKIDANLRRSASDWIDLAFSSSNKRRGEAVVDLVPELKKRKLHERDRWLVSNDLLDLIAADIWPGIHGQVAEVTTVKGKAPKKPPLSYEAKHALREIEGEIESIKSRMRHLNEHALRGLEFEARRSATFEDAHLWLAVAEEAKIQRDILAVHRTGKGEWYAVIEAIRSESSLIAKTAAIAHEKCSTREAAVEAGRRLMAQKAEWLGPEITLEVTIYSALEWSPGQE